MGRSLRTRGFGHLIAGMSVLMLRKLSDVVFTSIATSSSSSRLLESSAACRWRQVCDGACPPPRGTQAGQLIPSTIAQTTVYRLSFPGAILRNNCLCDLQRRPSGGTAGVLLH